MIGIIASSRVRQPYEFSAEALAIFNKATIEGFTLPSQIVQKSIDKLIKKMILSEVWAKQDLFLNFGYNNLALENFSRINWKNPSSALVTKYGTVTYKVDGWEGNLTDGYLGTNYNPSINAINFTQNNAGIGIGIRAYGAPTRNIYGQSTGTLSIFQGQTSARLNTLGGITYPTIASIQSMCQLNRTASSNSDIIINGTQYFDNVSTSVAIPSSEILIFNRSGALSSGRSSFFNIGSSLTFAEFQEFRTDYNDFLTSIGLTAIL